MHLASGRARIDQCGARVAGGGIRIDRPRGRQDFVCRIGQHQIIGAQSKAVVGATVTRHRTDSGETHAHFEVRVGQRIDLRNRAQIDASAADRLIRQRRHHRPRRITTAGIECTARRGIEHFDLDRIVEAVIDHASRQRDDGEVAGGGIKPPARSFGLDVAGNGPGRRARFKHVEAAQRRAGDRTQVRFAREDVERRLRHRTA